MSPQSSPGHLHYQEADNHRNTHGQLDTDPYANSSAGHLPVSQKGDLIISSKPLADNQWFHEVAALLPTMHYRVPRLSFIMTEEHCTRLLTRVMGVVRRVPC